MMHDLFDHDAPKKSANLSLNSDLLKQARECGINLSAALEQILIERVRQKQGETWRAENRDSIAAYNEYVDRSGTFSDEMRRF